MTQDTLAQEQKEIRREVIRFRTTERLWERIQIAAVVRRTSVQQLCTDAVVAYLDQTELSTTEESA